MSVGAAVGLRLAVVATLTFHFGALHLNYLSHLNFGSAASQKINYNKISSWRARSKV